MVGAREPREEPASENIDKEAEQEELETAGWERLEREGKVIWRNPDSGHLYPQGAALSLVRKSADDAPGDADDEA